MTNESVTLAWTLPLYDGGSPVIGYIIENSIFIEDEDEEPIWEKYNL